MIVKKLCIPLILFLVVGMLTLGFTVLAHQTAQADSGSNIILVDDDATGAANGFTWADAYTNVQDALAVAITGDEIWVAEGVYYPDEGSGQTDNSRSATFSLKSGVALYGGFAATETALTERDWTAHITVLSGDIDGNDTTNINGVVTTTTGISGSNAYHVVYSKNVNTAQLDGFTVTAGAANVSGSCPGSWCGGGMLNLGEYQYSYPTISHVVFIGNTTTGYGGGMVNTNYAIPTMNDVSFINNTAQNGGGMANNYHSAPTITIALFEGNSASAQGGGIYFQDDCDSVISDADFINNTAGDGGGFYAAGGTSELGGYHTITDVNFIGNHTTNTGWNTGLVYCNGGGGMCHIHGGDVSLTRVTFQNNTTTRGGGGLFIDDAGYTISLEDVEFENNISIYKGGGFYVENGDVIVSNSVFTNNQATTYSPDGGGMALIGDQLTMSSSTFSGNSGRTGGGLFISSGAMTLTNLTFSQNSSTVEGGGLAISSGSGSLTHAAFTGNTSPTGGGLSNRSNGVTFDDLTFIRNTASDRGGGFSNLGSAVITNAFFYGNTAAYGGGYRNYLNTKTSLANALFVGNRASSSGGGIHNEIADSSAWFTVTNTTFANNVNGDLYNYGACCSNDAFNTILSNCTLWGNSSSPLGHNYDAPVVRYSDVQGSYAGTGNLNVDPAFVSTPSSGGDSTWGTADDDYGDVRLTYASPVIDMGSDTYSTLSTDLAGNPRSMGAAVDMGAYEVETRQMAELYAETLYDFSPQVCASLWFTKTGAVPDSVVITLTHETPSAGGNGLPRRYEVVATGGSDYQGQLTLCYEDDELTQAGIDAGQEANLHAYRFTGSSTWEEYSVVDTGNNTVTANNVTEFGIWGLGIDGNQPTAVDLFALSANTGRWEIGWNLIQQYWHTAQGWFGMP